MLLTIALVLLSLQIKTPGIAAVRPFYYAAIFVLFVATVYFTPMVLRTARRLQREAWTLLIWLAVIYLYIFIQTVPMPMRALKDFILGASVDIGCLIVLLGYHFRGQATGKDTVQELAWILVLFGVVSGVVAWSSYFGWIGIAIAGHDFSHNPAWATRLHGWLGEPTQLGSAIGLGTLAGLYLVGSSITSSLHRVLCFAALLVFGATLYGAGTRNGLVSSTVGIGLMIILWRVRRPVLISGALTIFGGGLLTMMVIMNLGGTDLDYIRRMGERFPDMSPAQLQLFEAFRLNDLSGAMTRLKRFAGVIDIYRNNGVFEQILGAGYGFTRAVYGSAQNDYLESIVDFGALFLAIMLGYFAYIQLLLSRIMKGKDERTLRDAILGTALVGYSFTFAMNQAILFPDLFHFANFAHILAATIVIARFTRGEYCVAAVSPAALTTALPHARQRGSQAS